MRKALPISIPVICLLETRRNFAVSTFRRYVAKNLLHSLALDNRSNYKREDDFVKAVTKEVESGALKPKDAEKAIVWFYQNPDKLMNKLVQDGELYGI